MFAEFSVALFFFYLAVKGATGSTTAAKMANPDYPVAPFIPKYKLTTENHECFVILH